MENVNYLLLYQGNSEHGGHEACVRGFTKLSSAIIAMGKSYQSIANTLNLPIDDNRYTIRTENRIRLERYGEVFCWEIIEAVPEDSQPNATICQPGLKQFNSQQNQAGVIQQNSPIQQEYPVQSASKSHKGKSNQHS